MMTTEEFTYEVGDLLIWTKSSSLCLVLDKFEDEIKIVVIDGGKYPNWIGEVRGYNRRWLNKGVDFILLSESSCARNP